MRRCASALTCGSRARLAAAAFSPSCRRSSSSLRRLKPMSKWWLNRDSWATVILTATGEILLSACRGARYGCSLVGDFNGPPLRRRFRGDGNLNVSTPLWQFWTDWSVKALGTAATFLAVFVALFGSWLRNVIAPPRLTISLASGSGFPSILYGRNIATQELHQTAGFWYHVRVDNHTRWNPVSDVYVFLLSVEAPDAAGQFKPIWVGQTPLGWRLDANPQPKKIGYTAECDLCHILQDPLSLNLSPIVVGQVPSNFNQATRLRLTLRARGIERDSNELRVQIAWDGQWPDDRAEMSRHLVVELVPPPAAGR
jgi:hypothetical protein